MPCSIVEDNLIKSFKAAREPARFLSRFTDGSLGKAADFYGRKVFERKNEVIDNFMFSRSSDAYIKKLVTDKELTRESFDILFSWFRDLLLLKLNVRDEKLIHVDRKQDLGTLKDQYSFIELADILQEIVTTTQALEDNLNIKISIALIKEKTWRRR